VESRREWFKVVSLDYNAVFTHGSITPPCGSANPMSRNFQPQSSVHRPVQRLTAPATRLCAALRCASRAGVSSGVRLSCSPRVWRGIGASL
jgi:hypothetical protein